MGGLRSKKSGTKSMPRSDFNLILLGDPASGKATQAARLAKRYHLYDFDMGREVRKPAVRAKFDFAKTTGKGKLTPTGIVRDILHRTIRATPAGRGILFNGTPKMIGEARLAAKWLREYHRSDPLVLYVSIPLRETLARAEKRWARVGGKFVKRDDDTVVAIMNRRKYYREQVSQVVKFFKKKYQFKKISGIGSEAEVAKRIDAEVKKFLR